MAWIGEIFKTIVALLASAGLSPLIIFNVIVIVLALCLVGYFGYTIFNTLIATLKEMQGNMQSMQDNFSALQTSTANAFQTITNTMNSQIDKMQDVSREISQNQFTILNELKKLQDHNKNVSKEQAKNIYEKTISTFKHELEDFFYRTLERNHIAGNEDYITQKFNEHFDNLYSDSLSVLNLFEFNFRRLGDFHKSTNSELRHIMVNLCNRCLIKENTKDVPDYLERRIDKLISSFAEYLETNKLFQEQ